MIIKKKRNVFYNFIKIIFLLEITELENKN